jgi:hypothetical protein
MGQSVFDLSAVDRLQENASQEPNRIRGAKIEWALADSVDCLFQQLAHFADAFQWSLRENGLVTLPAAILPPALSTQLRQSLGVSMAKT